MGKALPTIAEIMDERDLVWNQWHDRLEMERLNRQVREHCFPTQMVVNRHQRRAAAKGTR